MQDKLTTRVTSLTNADPAETWKMAQAISKADIIPKSYQGSPANCFVAFDMAHRLGCGVMEIMQNTFVVHGTPGFSAKYIIGMCNKRGPFRGPIQFDYTPDADNPSVTAWAIVRETEARVEFTVDLRMAVAEGWTKNPKYKTMPQTMLSYRAGTLLVRLYAPETMLGLQTAEELEDIGPQGRAADDVASALDSEFIVRDLEAATPEAIPAAEPVEAAPEGDEVKN